MGISGGVGLRVVGIGQWGVSVGMRGVVVRVLDGDGLLLGLLLSGPLVLVAGNPEAENVGAVALLELGLERLDLNLVLLGDVLVLDGLVLHSGLQTHDSCSK